MVLKGVKLRMTKIADKLENLRSYVIWLKDEYRIEHLNYLIILNKIDEIKENIEYELKNNEGSDSDESL